MVHPTLWFRRLPLLRRLKGKDAINGQRRSIFVPVARSRGLLDPIYDRYCVVPAGCLVLFTTRMLACPGMNGCQKRVSPNWLCEVRCHTGAQELIVFVIDDMGG